MHFFLPKLPSRRSQKDRLYVGLYSENGALSTDNSYLWSLLVGPKEDAACCEATCYSAQPRAMTTLSGRQETRWAYQEVRTHMCRMEALVARVRLGKVKNTKRLATVLEQVPMRPEVQDWDSASWVKEGLEELEKDGKCLGTSVTHWSFVRDAALQLAQNDSARRMLHGEPEGEARDRVPTYDMLLRKEI